MKASSVIAVQGLVIVLQILSLPNDLCRFELTGWSEVMVKRTGNPNKEPASSADGLSENKCLLHCSVSASSSIGNGCVLEYCNIDENTVIGANSIVSNVHLPEGTEVPSNTFLHTVTVKVSDKGALFVTVAFGIDDNLKKTTSESELGKLKYFDVPLNVAMKLYDVSQVCEISFSFFAFTPILVGML